MLTLRTLGPAAWPVPRLRTRLAVSVMSTTQLLSPMPRHDVTSMAAGSANRASTRANAAL